MMEWIRCSERLPSSSERVLFATESGCVDMGIYKGKWYMDDGPVEDTYFSPVVAWMPIPTWP